MVLKRYSIRLVGIKRFLLNTRGGREKKDSIQTGLLEIIISKTYYRDRLTNKKLILAGHSPAISNAFVER